jgi:hypothetical protein
MGGISKIQGVYKRMVRFQKLTRNLFLTLHGQNVHRQQRQLSKLLMLTEGPRGQFPRWRRSRKRLSVCSVLRCPDLWLQCSVSFFLWGFVKDSVYIPPLPMSLKELRDRITHALQTITADMLHRVWDEFDYRVDACRVTQGAHIEGLWLMHEKPGQLPLLTVYVLPV